MKINELKPQTKNLFRLDSKVAVIAGGGGLIGSVLSAALAEQGAYVIVGDTNRASGENVCAQIQSAGGKGEFSQLDITQSANIASAIKTISSKHGRIDIWVNAAYPRTVDWNTDLESVSEESWDKNIKNHLGGYFICCQAVAKLMKNQKFGSVINLASIYGICAPDFSLYEQTGMTMPVAYAAIKGGLIQLTKYFASYYGAHGIRFNTVSPGGVFDNQPEPFLQKYTAKTPLGRMASPQDIAGAVIYLASDASVYVTGHNLVVDGGFSITQGHQ